MGYRVYDTEKHEWVKDNIYMNPEGDLFKIKYSLFGMIKIPLELSPYRYIYHEDIRLTDTNGDLIFEGDYMEARVGKVDEEDENSEDIIETGVVVYASDLSGFILLCDELNTFYSLSPAISNKIKIVGNVFDGYKEDIEDGKSTL